MKNVVITLTMLAIASPGYAQFGGLGGGLKKVQQAQEQKKKLDDLTISEQEELEIGAKVSTQIRQRFGVVQDPAIHKYVSLVGTLVARESERPKMPWTFIVLDTDGVNAFASPGGFVHITRGALGLIKSEAELAGVLAHEITHVAHKHTINAIKKNKAVQIGTESTLSNRGPFVEQMANRTYEMVLENSFDRGDEIDADTTGAKIVEKLGYASGGLADFLARLAERNKDQPAKNGLFASHPETKERIDRIRKSSGSKGGVTVAARYKGRVTYEETPITSIATITEGSAGLTGGGDDKKDAKKDEKAEAPKRSGFGLGNLVKGAAPEKQEAQTAASGGARGVGPDRLAKGGSNSTVVKVAALTDAELADFKKGIA